MGASYVVNASGQLEFTTATDPRAAYRDVPLDWFPDGQRLLFRRRPMGKGPDELFIAHVRDGRLERLRIARAGAASYRTGLVLDRETVVCRIRGRPDGRDGLYLCRRSGGRWVDRLLFPDTEERSYTQILWGGRARGGYRMVLRAKRGPGQGAATEFRYAVVPAVGKPTTRSIAEFRGGVRVAAASATATTLAVVHRPREAEGWRLTFIPTRGPARHARSTGGGAVCYALEFGPQGRRLLIAEPKSREMPGDFAGPSRGQLRIVDVGTLRSREVALGDRSAVGAGGMTDAEWMSTDTLAVGFRQFGVATLDVQTGKLRPFWQFPQ